MPALALLFSVLFASSPALAATTLICQSPSGTERVTVDTEWEKGGLVALTVMVGNEKIYDRVPMVEQSESQRQTYTSPNFLNRNKAPSALNLLTYVSEGKLLGYFNEVSFFPAVRFKNQLTCAAPARDQRL